ncbi:MAG: hypothetical protein QNJ20_02520 [Paracoccaceae bacterium]|nr:hypothetical protein [Paracoccaceae bacterium]
MSIAVPIIRKLISGLALDQAWFDARVELLSRLEVELQPLFILDQLISKASNGASL